MLRTPAAVTAGALVTALCLLPSVTARAAAPTNADRVSDGANTATWTLRSLLTLPADTTKVQGVSAENGITCVTTDLQDGVNGRLVGYTSTGAVSFDRGAIPIGHGQGLDVWNGVAYITATGISDPAVVVYDLASRAVLHTYPVSGLTRGAVFGVDRVNRRLLGITGHEGSSHQLVALSLTGSVLSRKPVAVSGRTQGIAVRNGHVLSLTTFGGTTTNDWRNQMTVYDTAGTMLKQHAVPLSNEGEGLTLTQDGRVVFGARQPGRLVEITPR